MINDLMSNVDGGVIFSLVLELDLTHVQKIIYVVEHLK